ncbi:MAG: bifunctional phosphopantothenoylcysteine decarboxylase/phosphopantothenate--cysteine ligase CoaBC [Deltaproteobacteria bacterium]|nr:bifunctional phosphopantothenoylcysteine decarboxylase/phosphopantothenate--cysteine ligase CoaBC [Deltaproteobacteria bacterium]
MSQGSRILLGVTGSIAAYKAAVLLRLLRRSGFEVQVVMTGRACQFVTPLTFEALSGHPVMTDLFAARGAPGRDASIEHVERAHDVALAVVAPASAHFLARLAHGFADDALTTVLLATRAPIVVAPAMETGMWENRATQENVHTLRERGVAFLGPAAGDLASGREGVGRMLEPEALAASIEAHFARLRTLEGLHVLVTAGPTWEPIDPVRVLTNRSTGAMGIAIAEAAAQRGARVTLVLGPTHLNPASHPSLGVVRVERAEEMLRAAERSVEDVDILIGTAAVTDFRPAVARAQKLKRLDETATHLDLVENPDILKTLAANLRARSRPALVVGFAAETQDMIEAARRKLREKQCDMVVANLVGPSRGFGPGASEVAIVTAEEPRGEPRAFGPAPKEEIAQFVLDQVVRARKEQGTHERTGGTPPDRSPAQD